MRIRLCRYTVSGSALRGNDMVGPPGQAVELDLLLHRAGIATVAVDQYQIELAHDTWQRNGNGRHPAGLTFGDLFAYALANATGDTLLFHGDGFAQPDITPVRP